MAKAPDAFRTISEVSESLDTPAHVLRFWESKFTQVKPVKRAGGRRYYRPEDLALLGGIKVLLHEHGMTIKGAQKVLREQGVKAVAALSPDPQDDLQADTGDTIDATVAPPHATPEVIEPVAPPPQTVVAPPADDTPAANAPTAPDNDAIAAPVEESAVETGDVPEADTVVDATPQVPEELTESQEMPDAATVAVAPDNVVPLPGLPRSDPAPRPVPGPRILALLGDCDRAVVAHNTAAIAPLLDRLAAVHGQMTKV